MKRTLLTTLALMAISISAFAADAHAHPAKTTPKIASLHCPVTGDKIASAKAAYNHETYKGKTYYFCCPECKPRFDKNRDQIIKHAAQGKYDKM